MYQNIITGHRNYRLYSGMGSYYNQIVIALMQGNDKDQIMKTVFRKNVGQSYIQIQYNKNTKKKNEQQEKAQQEEIQREVDGGSAILSRHHRPAKGLVTLKKQGYLYVAPEAGGFFSCFCAGRKAEIVTLENRLLSIRNGNGSLIKALNFDTCTVNIDSSGDTLKIKVRSDQKDKQRELYLQGTQNQNIKSWEDAIRKAIEGSMGAKYKLNYITTVPKYLEIESIPEIQFSLQCNTGDIVLFKSTHGMAKLQRGVTGSDYDHVAVVLRNSKDEIMLLESNSDTGVALTLWRDMVRFGWYEAAQKIVYRRLMNVERNETFLSTFQGFVADNLDKKFEMGLAKLMRFKSKVASKEEEKSRTYFCSELIAKCYKEVGLLEPQKSSTQYWPVDFSEAKSLPLLRGELGPQQLICFDKQICRKR